VSTHEIGDAAWGETTTPPREFASGPWSLQLRDDELADISFDGRVVLRSIRGVARDRDWGTLTPVVTSVTQTDTQLTVDVALGDLTAHLVVAAEGDELEVRWSCDVHADFWRNRLGLVVLHPPFVAGSALTVGHADGSIVETTYPLEISAHQPAFDIHSLEWQQGALATRLAFSGDVFEMEDQRNWTDASYKTYSTPLSLPFPVKVAAGETVSQSIRISCATLASIEATAASDRITLAETDRTVPRIGTSATTGPGDASSAPSPGDFLLVEIPAHTDAWRAVLDRAAAEANGLPLDVRIVGATAQRLDEVLDALAPLSLERVAVFTADTHVSEPELWYQLVDGLASRGLTAATVGGTRAHFTELNRTLHRLPWSIPAYAFSITPQMHATGREQIVESIAMQRLVAENAVRMTHAPVHVGPVTLRSRFNAVATTATPDALITDLTAGYGAAVTPDATDHRQTAPAVHAWTIASAAALSVDGVDSISWFEASGPRGLNDSPAAVAFEWLTELSGQPLLYAMDASADLWAIGARTGDTVTVLVANLRARAATVAVAALATEVSVELEPFSARRLVLTYA